MTDKSWMLNAKAIAAAKVCIGVVENELGIRLKLSNPDFLELLLSYAELNDSQELTAAVKTLAQYAPADMQASMELEIPTAVATNDETPVPQTGEVVEFNGRTFPRFQDGREFKGLYRGQPRYA